LRHFATPESKDSDDPLIWIFSKFEGDPRITSISQVAAQNYLYSPTCEDGSRNWDMEDKLADLEGMAASVWPFLAGGFTNLQKRAPIRKAVALFAAVLHLRHPRMLVEVGRLHERLVTLFKTFPKDANGNPCIAVVDHQGVRVPFDASDWPQYKIASPDQKHKIFVDNINQHAASCAEILLKKRWSVVFSDASLFITSDTPLALSNSGQETFGLNTPGTIVSLPLSPTRILIIDDRHDQPTVNTTRLRSASLRLSISSHGRAANVLCSPLALPIRYVQKCSPVKYERDVVEGRVLRYPRSPRREVLLWTNPAHV
jgi:hypothetical protein